MEISKTIISELDTNKLYIVSASIIPKANIFSKLIYYVSRDILHNDTSIKDKNIPIVTHTAFITFDHRKKQWLIHEVLNNGAVTSVFDLSSLRTKHLYATAIGTIDQSELKYIATKFNRDPSNISILTTLIHYPFFKAFASVELITPKYPVIGLTLNYIVDLLRDIWVLITNSILRIKTTTEFCTEICLDTINELNYQRIENNNSTLLVLPKPLMELIRKQNYKNYEIYPQNIIETCPITQLV